ncbi:MAG: hypothetical protein ABF991_09665 [Liquorilactobacillus hordei]|uniref:hypothetical protein n=1 Tax=Liquorilactobacillus hordei TaxID=468911 RepID=UPI0039EC7744
MNKVKFTVDSLMENVASEALSRIPIVGSVLNIIDKSWADVELEDRFKTLEETLKMNSEKVKVIENKIESLDVVDQLLLRENVIELIRSYSYSAFEKRREYLANAILNTVSLAQKDYQKNKFYITILNNIPDISIEFIDTWRNEIKEKNINLNEIKTNFGKENYDRLQLKYRTDISMDSVVKNCIGNGLIDIERGYYDEDSYVMNGDKVKLNSLSFDLLRFITLNKRENN